MTGARLRSVPTGPDVPPHLEDVDDSMHAADAPDLASDRLDTDLEPAVAALVGGTAVVVASSLLDFLR